MTQPEYSQGICGDGAAILKDGQPMTVEEIVAELRGKAQSSAALIAALTEIAEWTERWTTPGHPVATVARKAIDAAMAQQEAPQ